MVVSVFLFWSFGDRNITKSTWCFLKTMARRPEKEGCFSSVVSYVLLYFVLGKVILFFSVFQYLKRSVREMQGHLTKTGHLKNIIGGCSGITFQERWYQNRLVENEAMNYLLVCKVYDKSCEDCKTVVTLLLCPFISTSCYYLYPSGILVNCSFCWKCDHFPPLK